MNTHKLKAFFRGAKSIVRSRFFGWKPSFISHLITTRCFAKCPMCLWRSDLFTEEEKDTSKIISFYKQVTEFGFVGTYIWGGEPLIRDDIGIILKECKNFGLSVSLNTNGYLLPLKAKEIARSVDYAIISLDIPNSEHDKFRGVPDLFNNILIGLNRLRDENPDIKIFFNSIVSKVNYLYVKDLVELAKSLSVSISFNSVNLSFKGAFNTTDLRLDSDTEKIVFNYLLQLKKKNSVINNSKTYLKLFTGETQKYKCHFPKIYLQVLPNGNIINCINPLKEIGNVYHDNLSDVLKSSKIRDFCGVTKYCSLCKDSGVVEFSLFWEFKPEVVVNSFFRYAR